MTFIVYTNGNKELVSCGKKLGSGTSGDVFQLSHQTLTKCVMKIYKKPSIYKRKKLEAMLASPPDLQGLSHDKIPSMAWPTHLVEDAKGQCIGFVMPEIDFKKTKTLGVYTIEKSGDKELPSSSNTIHHRLQICKNLAASLGYLHSKNHAFIDLKEENIRCFTHNAFVILIDCDGFLITHKKNYTTYPAELITPGFLSPEACQGKKPRELNKDHDYFALAIIFFKILNKGIHPFQGKRTSVRLSNITDQTNDALTKLQIYTYGKKHHPELAPHLTSAHQFWDDELTDMFEQAFTEKDPAKRPSPAKWGALFEKLLSANTNFKRCPHHPTKNIYFAKKSCPVCALKNKK